MRIRNYATPRATSLLNLFSLISLFFTVSVVHAATFGVWTNSLCSGQTTTTYTIFPDLCTARLGIAISGYKCSQSSIHILIYLDSNSQKQLAPSCGGSGNVDFFEVSTTCNYISSLSGHVKLIDTSCQVSPNTLYIANPQVNTCSPYNEQIYTTIIADGTCRAFLDSNSFTYIASVGFHKSTIDFTIFSGSTICNVSAIDSQWYGMSMGSCESQRLRLGNNVFKSLTLTSPASFSVPNTNITTTTILIISFSCLAGLCLCCICCGALKKCRIRQYLVHCCDRCKKNAVDEHIPELVTPKKNAVGEVTRINALTIVVKMKEEHSQSDLKVSSSSLSTRSVFVPQHVSETKAPRALLSSTAISAAAAAAIKTHDEETNFFAFKDEHDKLLMVNNVNTLEDILRELSMEERNFFNISKNSLFKACCDFYKDNDNLPLTYNDVDIVFQQQLDGYKI